MCVKSRTVGRVWDAFAMVVENVKNVFDSHVRVSKACTEKKNIIITPTRNDDVHSIEARQQQKNMNNGIELTAICTGWKHA